MIYNRLGKSNLNVSRIGFGSYRVSSKIEQHQQALEFALNNGINLIDTSSNYADGESEILIGNTINKFLRSGKSREDFVLVSKGGYIQGKNLQIVDKRKTAGNPYEEIVICSPDLQHSINPVFLSDQIELSLSRLQTEYIDVYLLHNPEYFLTYTKMNSLTELRNEYYKRIEKAFRLLEEKAAEGKIKWYGISSNTFGANSDKLNFTSLEKVMDIAESISKENHFAVVQFPLNAVEKTNASIKNQKNNTVTFLNLAKENDLGVLVNRPLNGIKNNQIIRLADFEIKENITDKETLELARTISNLEKSISELAESVGNEETKKNINECLTCGDIIINNFDKFADISHFKEIRAQYLIPRGDYAVKSLFEYYKDDKEAITKINNYAVHLNILLDSCESVFAKRANEENFKLHEELNNYLDEENHNLTLSQKSVLMINSLEAVSCTLVGIRKTEYVKDILEMSDIKPQPKAYVYWGLD